MRLFKRKPKVCGIIGFTYNIHKPEEGVRLSLGYRKDNKLSDCSEHEVACYHIAFDELDWLIEYIQGVKNSFDKSE